MTTRILSVDEWSLLDGTELGSVLPLLTTCAHRVKVIAVFDDDGELSGSWAGLLMAHAEGVNVSEKHRGKSGVQRALLRAMKAVLAEWGVTSAITGSSDSAVTSLLTKKGRAVKLPDTYVLEL